MRFKKHLKDNLPHFIHLKSNLYNSWNLKGVIFEGDIVWDYHSRYYNFKAKLLALDHEEGNFHNQSKNLHIATMSIVHHAHN